MQPLHCLSLKASTVLSPPTLAPSRLHPRPPLHSRPSNQTRLKSQIPSPSHLRNHSCPFVKSVVQNPTRLQVPNSTILPTPPSPTNPFPPSPETPSPFSPFEPAPSQISNPQPLPPQKPSVPIREIRGSKPHPSTGPKFHHPAHPTLSDQPLRPRLPLHSRPSNQPHLKSQISNPPSPPPAMTESSSFPR
jgi:hypothetical protein